MNTREMKTTRAVTRARQLLGGAMTAVLLVMAPAASAVVIDFEGGSTSSSGGIFNGNPYIEDGFAVSTPDSGIYLFQDGWQLGRGSTNGTDTAYVFGGPTATISIARTDSAAFSLAALDVAEVFNNGDFAESGSAESVLITGALSGGGSVSMTFVLDGLSDGAGGVADFETITFGSGWSNLLSVDLVASVATPTIYGTNLNFDNIVVGAASPGGPGMPVSAPPVALLLMAGLMLLLHRRP